MNSDHISKSALNAAHWVTASPHEWKWTHADQVAMARYCLLASTVIHDALNALEKIVCTKSPDEGVILLSDDSPTHYDSEANCHVYDNEYFSPLGGALIALHKRLSSVAIGSAPASTSTPTEH